MAAQAVESKADEGARPEDIRAAEAQWRRAKAAAELAQTTYARTQQLYEQGVLAGQKADEARTNAVASAEQAKAARAQYDLALAGARLQDKKAASGQVQQARGAVAEVQAAADETRVIAPADGEIGKRLAQPGELVPQGFPVFTLTDTAHPWVTMNVREDQLHGLARGKELSGTIPALGNLRARTDIGEIYVKGQGVPPQPEEAILWYRLAAGMGWPNAQNALADMYRRGQGVEKDERASAALYDLAAKDEHGNVRMGDVVALDARGNYLRADGSKRLAVVGVSDLIVVTLGDDVLIIPRDRAQEVKSIVEYLAENPPR